MALAQRPRIGLSGFVYSVFNESTSTYGAINSIPNVQELSFDSAASLARLYGDDGVAFAADTVGDMAVSFKIADILPQDMANIFGYNYANGITEYSTLDQSAIVAMGFKTLRSGKDGANLVYDYFWLPRVKLQKPSIKSTTKGGTIEYQTPEIEGAVLKNSSNIYRTHTRTDDPAVAPATLSGWFGTVVESTGASLTAVTVGTITGASGAKTITIPFAKGGETFSLRTITDKDISVSVVSTGALIAGTSTYTYSAAGVAPTITIANANIAGVAYLVSVTGHVQDSNGVYVTAKSALVTPS